MNDHRSHRALVLLGLAGMVLAVSCAALAIASGLGYRMGWWPFRTGFSLLRWAAYGALAAAILSLVALMWQRVRRQWSLWPALGLIVGLAVVAVPAAWLYTAKSVPPIHDITTDVVNPPRMQALLAARQGAQNSAEYGGPDVARQQQQAYPEIVPLRISLPPGEVFAAALETARDSGWMVVAVQPEQGLIEASDRTFWFGFVDDVIVRVQPEGAGSRVDVRSVSRVGKSDVGTNAERIDRYLAQLRARLAGGA